MQITVIILDVSLVFKSLKINIFGTNFISFLQPGPGHEMQKEVLPKHQKWSWNATKTFHDHFLIIF